MDTILIISLGIVAYCVLYLILTTIFKQRIRIEERLDAIERREQTAEADPDIAKPFAERILKPTLQKAVNFFALFIPMNQETAARMNEQLMQAKINLTPKEYRASVLLFSAACVLGLFTYGMVIFPTWGLRILMALFGIYVALVLSRFHLKSRISKQQLAIYYQLPDVMDLLSVSVSAGLGFDQALSYVSRQMEGAFIDELTITQREIAMAMPRKTALERMAVRCNSEEVQIFVSAINQADELGSSLKNVMETQADTIRLTHKQNVEERAQKISIKIMLPMVLFILPVTFIIILGPAIPSILEALGGL